MKFVKVGLLIAFVYFLCLNLARMIVELVYGGNIFWAWSNRVMFDFAEASCIYSLFVLALLDFKWPHIQWPWFLLADIGLSAFLVFEHWDIASVFEWSLMVWIMYILSRGHEWSNRLYLMFFAFIVSELWEYPYASLLNNVPQTFSQIFLASWTLPDGIFYMNFNALFLCIPFLVWTIHNMSWKLTKTSFSALLFYSIFYSLFTVFPTTINTSIPQAFMRLPTVAFLIAFIFGGLPRRMPHSASTESQSFLPEIPQ